MADSTYRVLIVDDNRAIHDDYRKILRPTSANEQLDALEAMIFEEPELDVVQESRTDVILDSAFQGQQGLEMVRAAKESDTPYALVFVDMRMPPGWDGLETSKRLLEEDPFLQVVICTAYSDHSWDELQAVLGTTDRLLILKKPFDSVEVAQLVGCLTTRWALQRASATERIRLEELVSKRTRELEMQLEFRESVEASLRERQRLESLGSLTAGLSHELNNPLCAISSNVEYLTQEITAKSAEAEGEQSEILEVLDEISSASERIRDVVRDVRTFAVQQHTETNEELSVEAAVSNALRVTTPRLRHIARVIVEESEPAHTLGDRVQLEQVFVNLLLNAGDAFATSRLPRGERLISVGWESRGEWNDVWITDNGPGIPEENLERVMEPFFTTKPVGAGTGLGLSVCHGIMNAMKGKISIESAEGEGTTVRLQFPAAELEAESVQPLDDGKDPVEPKRVLIVDDDPDVRRAMKRALREFRVDVVGSAAEGIVACEKDRYDIILCDLMMPDGLGTDMYTALQNSGCEQSENLYLITGGAVTDAGISGLSSFPPERVLTKPLSPFHVWDILHQGA